MEMDLDLLMPLILQAGAVKAGVAPLEPVEPQEFAYYVRWLAEGRHGTMTYLANHLEIRRNPALLLSTDQEAEPAPSTGSILSFAFPYFSGDPYLPGKLRFARYALGDDYHEAIRQRLRPIAAAITEATGCEARICVDTAPILERYWAVRAGLGYIGRNHQLIIPGIGSHIFLAEIVTRAHITTHACTSATPACTSASQPHSCTNCGACLRACPLSALTPDGFDARHCLSYLTIEAQSKGAHDKGVAASPHREQPAPPISSLPTHRKYFYGCDLCLDACPQAKGNTPCLPEFTPRPRLLTLTPSLITTLTPAEYTHLFRHSAIKRIKLTGLQRLTPPPPKGAG